VRELAVRGLDAAVHKSLVSTAALPLSVRGGRHERVLGDRTKVRDNRRLVPQSSLLRSPSLSAHTLWTAQLYRIVRMEYLPYASRRASFISIPPVLGVASGTAGLGFPARGLYRRAPSVTLVAVRGPLRQQLASGQRPNRVALEDGSAFRRGLVTHESCHLGRKLRGLPSCERPRRWKSPSQAPDQPTGRGAVAPATPGIPAQET
jgi:hypothetical protein